MFISLLDLERLPWMSILTGTSCWSIKKCREIFMRIVV